MPPATPARLVTLLDELWTRDLRGSYDSVASGRSADVVVRRHVEIFLQYRRFIRPGVVLDWGCRHAPDACLARAACNGKLELHGCDVGPPAFPAAHAYAGLEYRRLEHPWRLPHPDGTFDTIIGSGVLEHVPVDDASLGELRRVLRPGGHLIITFLPNRLSYTEAIAGRLGLLHHDRLYSLSGFRRTLLRHELRPLQVGYHQVMPSLAGKAHRLGRLGRPALRIAQATFGTNRMLERIWPLRMLAANIWAVALCR